jgi:hypothetical protein
VSDFRLPNASAAMRPERYQTLNQNSLQAPPHSFGLCGDPEPSKGVQDEALRIESLGWLRLPRDRGQVQKKAWHTPAFRGSQPTLRRDYTPLLQNATTPHALPRTEFEHAAFSLITHRPLTPPPLSPSVFKAPLRFLANSRYVKTTLRLSSATPLSGAHNRPGAS